MSTTKGEGFKLEWFGDEVIQDIHVSLEEGIDENSLDLQRKTMPRIPIESNDLRNDLSIDRSKIKQLVNEIGFSLPYALKQHEELGYDHTRTDGYRIATGKNAGKSVNLIAGGEAKFLENTFNKEKRKYTRNLANKAKKVLE